MTIDDQQPNEDLSRVADAMSDGDPAALDPELGIA